MYFIFGFSTTGAVLGSAGNNCAYWSAKAAKSKAALNGDGSWLFGITVPDCSGIIISGPASPTR